jgi:hypothetical protein
MLTLKMFILKFANYQKYFFNSLIIKNAHPRKIPNEKCPLSKNP